MSPIGGVITPGMPTPGMPTPGTQQQSSTQSAHKHAVSSEERAVVVGKCLTPTTGANQTIEVLVDIAG